VEAQKYKVLDEVLKVLSFWINKKSILQCDSSNTENYIKKKEFCKKFSPYGDLIANLVVYEEFLNKTLAGATKRHIKEWCDDNSYNMYSLYRSESNLKELRELCNKKLPNKKDTQSKSKETSKPMEILRPEVFENINKAFLSGYY
jgi:hypothetical protein